MDGFVTIGGNNERKTVSGIAIPPPPITLPPKKICTVEELERNLLKTKQQQQKHVLPPSFPSVSHQPYHHIFPPVRNIVFKKVRKFF